MKPATPASPALSSAPTRRPPPFKAGAALGSVALTQPHRVRDAAALVFNRFRKQWGSNPSSAQVRTLAVPQGHRGP